jgi:hypothetical protein
MSEEIVDRLKAEGQLLRNTGTNSVRTVKIELAKFNDIFSVISDNIAKQTEMMAKSLDIQSDNFKISQETRERETARKQIESLDDDDDEVDKPSVEREKEKEDSEGKGLFSLLGGMGLTKLLFGGALLTGGVFAAYNFAKGFVDENYNNAWSNFETGLVETLQGLDFQAIKDTFSNIVTGLIAVGAAVLGVKTALLAMQTTIAAIRVAELLGLRTPRAPGVPPAVPPRAPPGAAAPAAAARGGVMRSILGAVTRFGGPAMAAAFVGSEFYKIWSDRQGMTPEEIEANIRALAESGQMEDPASELLPFMDGTYDNTPPAQPTEIDNARRRLEGLNEARARMFTDAIDNESTSGVYTAPDTSSIDEDIERAKEELIQKLRDRHNELDQSLIRMEDAGATATEAYQNSVNELSRIGGQLIDLGAYPTGSVEIRPAGDQSSLQGIPSNAASVDTAGLLRSISGGNDILRGSEVLDSMLQQKLASAAMGSGLNMPVIVNNNPNVSPVFNNVTTGPSVTTNTMFGLGGSGSGAAGATFGLSNAFS